MKIPTYKREATSEILERSIREAFTAETGLLSVVTAQYLEIYNPRWRFKVSLKGRVVTRESREEEIRAYGSYEVAGQHLGRLLAAQWEAEVNPQK